LDENDELNSSEKRNNYPKNDIDKIFEMKKKKSFEILKIVAF
jgi:hypothetical protein